MDAWGQLFRVIWFGGVSGEASLFDVRFHQLSERGQDTAYSWTYLRHLGSVKVYRLEHRKALVVSTLVISGVENICHGHRGWVHNWVVNAFKLLLIFRILTLRVLVSLEKYVFRSDYFLKFSNSSELIWFLIKLGKLLFVLHICFSKVPIVKLHGFLMINLQVIFILIDYHANFLRILFREVIFIDWNTNRISILILTSYVLDKFI